MGTHTINEKRGILLKTEVQKLYIYISLSSLLAPKLGHNSSANYIMDPCSRYNMVQGSIHTCENTPFDLFLTRRFSSFFLFFVASISFLFFVTKNQNTQFLVFPQFPQYRRKQILECNNPNFSCVFN